MFGSTTDSVGVALQWDGTVWSRTGVPSSGDEVSSLNDVTAISSTDAWAVGNAGSSAIGRTLALHWNGSAWTPVATPSPGTRDSTLLAATGSSTSDVWAVGCFRDLPYGNRARHSLAMHWNGSSWSRTSTPDFGDAAHAQTVLSDVVELSPADVWAVGYTNGIGGSNRAVVLRWGGTTWNEAPAPGLASLSSITALSATDIWATGLDSSGQPRVANWRGSGWTVTKAPTPSSAPNAFLPALTAAEPSTLLAVGSTWDSTTGESHPLALRGTGG